MQYASTITKISDSDNTIIKHSGKTLFFHNNQPWDKKSGDPDFDVPMSCYDVAQDCDLNKLSNIINKYSIGLYRDDSLGIFDKLSEPQIEQRKKKSIKIFKKCGHSIMETSNITSADFLYITLNLEIKSY